jgi:predicted GNAT family acetyltransferase
METEEIVELICTAETFVPVGHEGVRWLDQDGDLALYQDAVYRKIGAEVPSEEDWEEWHRQGYRYCGLVRGSTIVALAAVWAYSDAAWELAAVRTQPDYRGRGHAKSVCSFATAHILAAGRTATCHTALTNTAMLQVAERLGYHRHSLERWRQPTVPLGGHGQGSVSTVEEQPPQERSEG